MSNQFRLSVSARRLLGFTIVAALAVAYWGAALSASAAAAWPSAGFTEGTATQSAKFADVRITAVSVDAPLPASFGAHPAACDKLNFLRMRRASGPADPSDADKILVAQPGVLEGASAFMPVGSNIVHRAWTERGANVEFWAIDRRANCLEDVNGLEWAKTSGDPHKLLDYYYGGASFNGSRFAGFLTKDSPDVKWLGKMGLDQTLKDWNEVITRGVPDPLTRQNKVYCGGHSLGGIITGAYADYDFDGDPGTLGDAGFMQCKGYFGLDTLVTDDPVKLRQIGPMLGVDQLASTITNGSDALLQSGLIAPFVSIPGIDPQIMYLLSGVGAAAAVQPTVESDLVDRLPADLAVRFAYRLYYSRNLTNFLTGSPTLSDFRMTNQALLGTFMDDNAMPLSIVQTSVGFYSGGPVADKNFPFPNFIGQVPGIDWFTNGLLGTGKLAIPTDYGWHCRLVIFCGYTPGTGPLYKWRNYNEVGSDGKPYTTPAAEVSDINDLATGLSALPINFIEGYFPMKLNLDAFLMFGGSSGASPGQVHPQGVASRPNLNIFAGDGPIRGLAPLLSPQSPVVPGYQHLDVLSAAPTQNNGMPEQTSSLMLDYLFN